MNDNPLLRTPGELLSQARNEQSLTIEQLSERTKIPPPVLVSLELDEYHKISGPLYIKSFLRTCAVDLGMDPDQVLDLYSRFAGEKQPTASGQEGVWQDEVEISHVGLPWTRIVMAAGVGVVLLGVLLFTLRGCGSNSSAEGRASDSSSPAITAGDPSADEAAATDGAQEGPLVASVQTETGETGRQSLLAPGTTGHPDAMNAAPGGAHAWPDTLALGWATGRDPDLDETESAGDPNPAQEDSSTTPTLSTPSPVPATPQEAVSDPTHGTSGQAAQDTPAISQAGAGAAAPTPKNPPPKSVVRSEAFEPLVSGDPVVQFGDGRVYPVVLRLVCRAPLRADIKCDGATTFLGALWPRAGQAAPAVPSGGVEQGWAYDVQGDLTVFWGANEYFSLRLGSVDGVAVFINGERHSLSGIRAGDEFMLFPPAPDSPDGG